MLNSLCNVGMSRGVVGYTVLSSETKAAELPRQRNFGRSGGGSSALTRHSSFCFHYYYPHDCFFFFFFKKAMGIFLTLPIRPSVCPSRYPLQNHRVEFYQTCYITSAHGKVVREQHYISVRPSVLLWVVYHVKVSGARLAGAGIATVS